MTLNTLKAAAAGLVLAMPMVLPLSAAAEELLKPVKLMTTEGGFVVLERQFFGQVAAKETVDLAFQVGGQVFELPVDEGVVVPKGALIAQLDLEPFNLQLEQARLRKEQADRTLERNSRLQGTVSQVTIEDAETEASLADVGLRNAMNDLDHATLQAPYDAMIARREVALFSTVSPGTPIARIHDLSELHVEIDVPEVLFQRASDDDDVSIVALFPGSDTEYPATIREYVAEASAVGQTYRVTLKMDPPKDRQVLPGASTTVKVKVQTSGQHIAVPATAIVPHTDGTPGVMVFAPAGADEGTVTWTKVEIQPNQFGNFDVLSGVEPGQEIMAAGGHGVKDGQSVRRFTGFNN